MESESKPVDNTDETRPSEATKNEASEKSGGTNAASSRTGDNPDAIASAPLYAFESLSDIQGDNPDAIAIAPEELQQIQERKKQATSIAGRPAGGSGTEGSITGQHHYRMLDTVLDQIPPARRFKQPMLFDIILALGLLVAVAGFTTGLMRIYVTHMAKQSINQHNYKAAITILKRNPVPEFFSGFGSDPNELLNQALYLDAMTKLEANSEDQAALSQLSKITAGSRFFHLAQEILKENSRPSDLKLESGATHVAGPDEIATPKEPLFQNEEE